ncbi:MAG: hypothetical protein QM774_01365 [Gordonia sp. (in: high G+C Gram-positive bacteria)]|uniref:hypothetical protein n=1 Tax=Gordonia sp. (in: high G+C Gram-positive bacteria) TaxID=84139 RepID=UPI0039E29D56
MPDLRSSTTVEALRRQLSQLQGTPAERPASRTVLPVPGPLAGLLPRRGLPPGSVVEVAGASTVAMAVLAQVSAAGSTAALIGLPQLNLAVAEDLGADLNRIAVVEQPGVDALDVAAVLLDGIDLVLVAAQRVTPSRARVLAGRARRQSSVLLAVGESGCWPGAAIRFEGRVAGYRHVLGTGHQPSGYGRIGGLELEVRVSGTGLAPSTVRCELTEPGLGEPGRPELVEIDVATGRPRLAVAN